MKIKTTYGFDPAAAPAKAQEPNYAVHYWPFTPILLALVVQGYGHLLTFDPVMVGLFGVLGGLAGAAYFAWFTGTRKNPLIFLAFCSLGAVSQSVRELMFDYAGWTTLFYYSIATLIGRYASNPVHTRLEGAELTEVEGPNQVFPSYYGLDGGPWVPNESSMDWEVTGDIAVTYGMPARAQVGLPSSWSQPGRIFVSLCLIGLALYCFWHAFVYWETSGGFGELVGGSGYMFLLLAAGVGLIEFSISSVLRA